MPVNHADLPDADLHEPKGVAAAANTTVYKANGAGSGAWANVEGSELKSTTQDNGRIMMANGSGGVSWANLVWNDIIGFPVARNSGATAPTYAAFRGGSVDAYHFALNDEIGFAYHIPHDYAPGTDVFLHVHWGHNGTAISGTCTWTYHATYAKGHGQGAGSVYGAEVTAATITHDCTADAPAQYEHFVTEAQLSTSGGSGTQLDTDAIEVDGVILVNITLTSLPTITGGTGEPFLFTADIHYQSGYFGTTNKVPNFYA